MNRFFFAYKLIIKTLQVQIKSIIKYFFLMFILLMFFLHSVNSTNKQKICFLFIFSASVKNKNTYN